ncbi:MAG TPA: hypothetical protein VFH39_03715 [Candidatus Saccharimonadales bacterium]|nr:hypothetical protein [Candidatus Saccharimonadales bacterium]
MVNRNQSGAINVLLLPLIIAVLLLIAAGSFGYWAYSGRQDYKNNVDAKIAVAVANAVKAEDVKKAAEYVEASKQPLRTYVGPEQYGALRVM